VQLIRSTSPLACGLRGGAISGSSYQLEPAKASQWKRQKLNQSGIGVKLSKSICLYGVTCGKWRQMAFQGGVANDGIVVLVACTRRCGTHQDLIIPLVMFPKQMGCIAHTGFKREFQHLIWFEAKSLIVVQDWASWFECFSIYSGGTACRTFHGSLPSFHFCHVLLFCN
jgi:hypothetical protein